MSFRPLTLEEYQAGEVLCFNKPLYWTSFNLVGKVRWALCRHLKVKKLKVGHAGTLDPMATGVMLLCTGKATKLIEQLQAGEKEYVAGIKLGATTPSYDLEHAPDCFFPTEHITKEAVENVLRSFEGDIMQVPPVFSAVKIDGKRAYDYARKGQDVEIRPKPIHIEKIELLECNLPDLKIRVVCGKGTYIRSLARDIGEALGSGAHLTSLVRTRVGEYTIENSLDFDEFKAALGQNDSNYNDNTDVGPLNIKA